MNKYPLRLNFTGIHTEGTSKIRGKIAFKTRETHWLHTELPSIALISIDSDFHKGIDGDLKTGAFISIIKEHTKRAVSILLADTAHIHTQKIKYNTKALEECIRSTDLLVKRYCSYFEDCNLLYWSSTICQSEHFVKSLEQVQDLYRIDKTFRELLDKDAKSSYSEKRKIEFPDETIFIERTKADIIEQSASILVLSKQGYRYQFYPGASFTSIQYVNYILLPPEKQVYWIDVFLSIEKKASLMNLSH